MLPSIVSICVTKKVITLFWLNVEDVQSFLESFVFGRRGFSIQPVTEFCIYVSFFHQSMQIKEVMIFGHY